MNAGAEHAAPRPRLPEIHRAVRAIMDLRQIEGGADHVTAAEVVGLCGEIGLGERGVRSALERMRASGDLVAERHGRTLRLSLGARLRGRLVEARAEMHSTNVFAPADSDWTLVSFSIDESLRPLRHSLRRQLQWHGFGALRDGVWIAPRLVDVPALLGRLAGPPDDVQLDAFRVPPQPLAPQLAAAIWPLAEARAAHLDFQQRWRGHPGELSPEAASVLLLCDWIELFAIDPRLPASLLPADWPSARSLELFTEQRARERARGSQHD